MKKAKPQRMLLRNVVSYFRQIAAKDKNKFSLKQKYSVSFKNA
jgi:hypothetical protein